MQQARRKELENFLNQFDITINDYELLNTSLTHPSYVFERENEDISQDRKSVV